MEKKSKYEKQKEKWKKAKEKIWKRLVVSFIAIYSVSVLIGVLSGLPLLYTARSILFGLVLIVLSVITGMNIQSEIDAHYIPPMGEEVPPEMKEKVEEE